MTDQVQLSGSVKRKKLDVRKKISMHLEFNPCDFMTKNGYPLTNCCEEFKKKYGEAFDDHAYDERFHDMEAENLVKYLENKYRNKRDQRGRKLYFGTAEDMIDKTAGYDAEDSFIDDSETYDTRLPSTMDTLKGGFHVNRGRLELKNLDLGMDSDSDGPSDSLQREQSAIDERRLVGMPPTLRGIDKVKGRPRKSKDTDQGHQTVDGNDNSIEKPEAVPSEDDSRKLTSKDPPKSDKVKTSTNFPLDLPPQSKRLQQLIDNFKEKLREFGAPQSKVRLHDAHVDMCIEIERQCLSDGLNQVQKARIVAVLANWVNMNRQSLNLRIKTHKERKLHTGVPPQTSRQNPDPADRAIREVVEAVSIRNILQNSGNDIVNVSSAKLTSGMNDVSQSVEELSTQVLTHSEHFKHALQDRIDELNKECTTKTMQATNNGTEYPKKRFTWTPSLKHSLSCLLRSFRDLDQGPTTNVQTTIRRFLEMSLLPQVDLAGQWITVEDVIKEAFKSSPADASPVGQSTPLDQKTPGVSLNCMFSAQTLSSLATTSHGLQICQDAIDNQMNQMKAVESEGFTSAEMPRQLNSTQWNHKKQAAYLILKKQHETQMLLDHGLKMQQIEAKKQQRKRERQQRIQMKQQKDEDNRLLALKRQKSSEKQQLEQQKQLLIQRELQQQQQQVKLKMQQEFQKRQLDQLSLHKKQQQQQQQQQQQFSDFSLPQRSMLIQHASNPLLTTSHMPSCSSQAVLLQQHQFESLLMKMLQENKLNGKQVIHLKQMSHNGVELNKILQTVYEIIGRSSYLQYFAGPIN